MLLSKHVKQNLLQEGTYCPEFYFNHLIYWTKLQYIILCNNIEQYYGINYNQDHKYDVQK